MKVIHLALLLLITSASLNAEEFIPLTSEEATRLSILFEPAAELNRQSGNRFAATVTNSPDTYSLVTAPYAGLIERWHITPGEFVTGGTVLATIRSADLLELQNQWMQAGSTLQQSMLAVARDKELLEQGIISRQRLQQTQREYDHAQIMVSALEARLARAGFTDSELGDLSLHKLKLGNYSLRAPASGRLTHRAIVVGEHVSEFDEVASLQESLRPWLSVEVPARIAALIKPGDSLSLAASGETLTLQHKDLQVNQTSQTVELLAEFDSEVAYLPGQILSVILPPHETGVLIPADAVVHSNDLTIVYVQANQGVQARTLELQPAGSNYLAQTGISAGEQIVVQGAAIIKGVQLGLGSDD
jgi:RND family efflux transporter MFP subunit